MATPRKRGGARLLALALALLASVTFGTLATPQEAAAQPECSDYPLLPHEPYWDPTDRTYVPCALSRAQHAPDDPGPTNPYCDLYDPAPGRVCVTVKKDYRFQAVDTSTGATNSCTVTLEGAAPESQTDPANRPDVQYRSSITCQHALQVISMKPALYTAMGAYLASAPEVWCHPSTGGCQTSYSTGSRGLREGNSVYVQRTYVKLILPGGPDPWILAEGKPAAGPGSCAPGNENGYVVECLLELDIPTTPPQG